MPSTAPAIREIITSALPRLKAIPAATARQKPDAKEWSKQEILGHLIDSTLNNHQRFVRGSYNAAAEVPPYQQERWVELQAYNDRDWNELIDLWAAVNGHLCAAMDRLPEEAFANSCGIGRAEPVTLQFVADDYIRHINMHLGDIFK